MKLTIGTTESGNAFTLPIEAVTQTFGILAKRGVGKTYTASVMAEEMLAAHQQIVAIDPTGAWWGLRSKYPVVVLGGEHADIPLEPSAGEVIAQAIVENRFPAVIDLSLFRKGEMIRFMVSFAETLYRLNREAVHLFVDEADAVAPQAKNYGGDENRMLGAMEDIVRRGRKRGIGCTLITQRPAVLNKNVLTQCEVLVALRMVHPKDIDAIKEWVNVHADPIKAKSMIDSLPSLPVGTAYFWAPGFGDIFERVNIRKRQTFDSSATPKPGETATAPKTWAEIDPAKLGEKIMATVEKQKADDPKELRRRITALETQLKAAAAKPEQPEAIRIEVPTPILKDSQISRLEKVAEKFLAVNGTAHAIGTEIANAIKAFTANPSSLVARPSIRPAIAPPRPATPRIPLRTPPTVNGSGEGEKMGKCERSILTALAQHGECEKERAAKLAGYAVGGGGFLNALGALRSAGYVDGDPLYITNAGMEALGKWTPLPTGRALFDYWHAKLGRAEQEILRVLYEAAGKPMSKDAIAADTVSATGRPYEASGGGFLNAVGALRTLALVEGRGELRAADELFIE